MVLIDSCNGLGSMNIPWHTETQRLSSIMIGIPRTETTNCPCDNALYVFMVLLQEKMEKRAMRNETKSLLTKQMAGISSQCLRSLLLMP